MDTRVIGSLISLMENSTLSVMDIVEGEFEIHMEKPSSSNGSGVSASYVDVEPVTPPVTMQVAAPQAGGPPAPAPVSTPPVTQEAPAAPAPAAEGPLTDIKSPLVGTFHPLSTSTDSPDVQVGDHVTKGQVICILEAMKLMNEIESDYSGTVKEVLVSDGDLVEFDQPLFKIQED